MELTEILTHAHNNELTPIVPTPILKIKRQNAFTLIEMSIVMVIIGLIVAAISAAQGMVKQNQLRTVMSDLAFYQSALNTFKSTFGALPGDMRNATTIWPTTTNGNGNGYIETSAGEDLPSWQQLALAGIIPGNYKGTGGQIPGVTVPALKYDTSVGFDYDQANGVTFFGLLNFGNNFNMMTISGSLNACCGQLNGGAFKAIDTYNIDSKIDDGIPNTGNIMASAGFPNISAGFCTTQQYTAPLGAIVNYVLTDNGPNCRIYYPNSSTVGIIVRIRRITMPQLPCW